MKSKGRLKAEMTGKRDHIETAQACLSGMLKDVDEIIVRNQQAIRRTHLVSDVLDPAVERLQGMRRELRLAHSELNSAWSEGQKKRWEQHD